MLGSIQEFLLGIGKFTSPRNRAGQGGEALGSRPRASTFVERNRVADSDRLRQAPRRKNAGRAYARGGSVSDMIRLLERDEARLQSRPVRNRLVMAGIVIVVVVVLVFVALRFLDG